MLTDDKGRGRKWKVSHRLVTKVVCKHTDNKGRGRKLKVSHRLVTKVVCKH